jgi:hypothetical protein
VADRINSEQLAGRISLIGVSEDPRNTKIQIGGVNMAQCIVIVQFDLPKRTEEQAIKGGTGTAPTYRNLATKGLIRKDYLNGDAGTGGAYLWESRQAAEAWFTEAKITELTERFGARPRLTWYDTYVTVDNVKGETRVNRSALTSAAE